MDTRVVDENVQLAAGQRRHLVFGGVDAVAVSHLEEEGADPRAGDLLERLWLAGSSNDEAAWSCLVRR